MTQKSIYLTLLALIAFAANSVLCRLALGENSIDPASFTFIRLLSGTLILLLIVWLKSKRHHPHQPSRASWTAAFMLFLYASCFSFAYIRLDTATGALILFACVQISMLLYHLYTGKHLNAWEWFGMALALLGFIYLMLPGLQTPSWQGFILMSIAGIAWAAYTLKGRHSSDALRDTAYNFLRSLPFIILLTIFTLPQAFYSLQGIGLAILSGAIASGLGYSIWYIVIKALSNTQAAVVQLSVPLIAALGGIVFIDESIDTHFIIASFIILTGISCVILGRTSNSHSKNTQQ